MFISSFFSASSDSFIYLFFLLVAIAFLYKLIPYRPSQAHSYITDLFVVVVVVRNARPSVDGNSADR